MLITLFLVLALLLAVSGWLYYRNFTHPYLQALRPMTTTDQQRLQRRARGLVTAHSAPLKRLYWCAQLAWLIGVVLILISFYNLETKLTLLIFPADTAMVSVALLVTGVLFLLIPTLIWPTQSYAYWAQHVHDQSEFKLVATTAFKRYRRDQVGSVIALGLFILITWIARALSISTQPILVVEYLIVTVVAAIPAVALISLLVQLPYLYHNRYLLVKPGHQVTWGTLHYQANRALIEQRPAAKKRIVTVAVARLIALLFTLLALWTLYANIWAPAFTVDPSAVFPAAIYALFTLVILETIGALWPTKLYDQLHALTTDKLPFTVRDRDHFDRFHSHLYHFHLSAGIVWVAAWLMIVGTYYYFN